MFITPEIILALAALINAICSARWGGFAAAILSQSRAVR